MFINPNKTASFTGHRILGTDFDRDKLYQEIKRLILAKYDTFLVGMAIGFDTECFKALLEFRKAMDIKIIACIPCLNQSERFNKKQKDEYLELLSKADDKIVISKEYTDTCMKKRNEFMVDYSTTIVAYLRKEKSGTASTVNYAIKKGKNVRFI